MEKIFAASIQFDSFVNAFYSGNAIKKEEIAA
jgi:hypothetical protein